MTVANAGPWTATKVGTTLVVPHGFTVTSPGGGTLFGREVVMFRDASLAAHSTVTYTVTLTASMTAGIYQTDATTSSGVVDTNQRNNSVELAITVT